MASSNITITSNEYRPCLVGNKKALFHRWNEFNKPVPGGITPIDPPPGQIKYTLGLVEYSDGQVEEVAPHKIKFIDNKMQEYSFKNIETE